MKLVRSDSPEVIRSIASAEVCARRQRYTLGFFYAANILLFLVALTLSRTVSARAGIWLGVPFFLLLNAFLFWTDRSRRLNWVMAECADRIYVRLFSRRARDRGELNGPDVLVLERSEIASMSIRTLEVFIYGPEPKIVEWLMIEPAGGVVNQLSDQIRTSLRQDDPAKQMHLEYEQGRLLMKWTLCRPVLPVFLRQLAQACPSVVIGQEERSELDLNGIWHGLREYPNAEQRRMLVQAKRLGFGRELPKLLWLHRNMQYGQTGAYLEEIEQEGDEIDAAPAQISSLSSQTVSPEPARAIHAPACSAQSGQSQIFVIALLLGLTYVEVRAAVSVTALTYASTGRSGLRFLLSWSLVYFGICELIALWVRLRGSATVRRLYGIGVASPFLALAVIALIVKLSFNHSEMGSRAYSLRILIVASALFTLLSFSMSVSRLIRARPESGVRDRQPRDEAVDYAIGGSYGNVDQWSTMNAFERSLLVVSCVFNATVWTWLVIYYRYYVPSFLEQSSLWVMATLWIFIASWWLGCANIVIAAFLTAKEGSAKVSAVE